MSYPREEYKDPMRHLPEEAISLLEELRAIRQLEKELPSLPNGKHKSNLQMLLAEFTDLPDYKSLKTSLIDKDKVIQLKDTEIANLNRKIERSYDESVSRDVISPSKSSGFGLFTLFCVAILCFFIGIWQGMTKFRRDAAIPEEKVEPSLKS